MRRRAVDRALRSTIDRDEVGRLRARLEADRMALPAEVTSNVASGSEHLRQTAAAENDDE